MEISNKQYKYTKNIITYLVQLTEKTYLFPQISIK